MYDLLQTLAIASAIVIGIFVVHYFHHRTAVAQTLANVREGTPTRGKNLQSEVAALRARVEVLERIVTDKGYELRDAMSDL